MSTDKNFLEWAKRYKKKDAKFSVANDTLVGSGTVKMVCITLLCKEGRWGFQTMIDPKSLTPQKWRGVMSTKIRELRLSYQRALDIKNGELDV